MGAVSNKEESPFLISLTVFLQRGLPLYPEYGGNRFLVMLRFQVLLE
jgi:hypothetical protein